MDLKQAIICFKKFASGTGLGLALNFNYFKINFINF